MREPCGRVRVLLAADEADLVLLLRRTLSGWEWTVEVASSAELALRMAQARRYDAILLDAALRGVDGFESCVRLREAGVWTPILMLTSRAVVTERIRALDGGADDCLSKPVAARELMARLRALARRGTPERPIVLHAGDLRLDPAGGRAWRGETEIALSAKELVLLELLMRRSGDVVSRYELLDHAWDASYNNRSNIVAVYIKRLRTKVDDAFGRSAIQTVRGFGYRLRPDGG